MEVNIRKKSTEDINKTPVFQQSAFWSHVKRKHGIHSNAFDIKVRAADLYTAVRQQNYIIDDILILFQNIGDGYKIGYVPYGPTLKPSEENLGIFLEELSESLRPYLTAKCIMIRYDLLWESLWAKDDSYFDDNGLWTGPPEKASQEIRLNFDTQKWNLKKSNSLNRHYMATYALQWEAIRRARKRGCTEYDMFGISPRPDNSHPLYGLYRFKTGFGGDLFHRMGCWDYLFNSGIYEKYLRAEMNSKGFHSH